MVPSMEIPSLSPYLMFGMLFYMHVDFASSYQPFFWGGAPWHRSYVRVTYAEFKSHSFTVRLCSCAESLFRSKKLQLRLTVHSCHSLSTASFPNFLNNEEPEGFSMCWPNKHLWKLSTSLVCCTAQVSFTATTVHLLSASSFYQLSRVISLSLHPVAVKS